MLLRPLLAKRHVKILVFLKMFTCSTNALVAHHEYLVILYAEISFSSRVLLHLTGGSWSLDDPNNKRLPASYQAVELEDKLISKLSKLIIMAYVI